MKFISNPTYHAAFNQTLLTINAAEKELARLQTEPQAQGLLADYEPSLKKLLGHEGGYTNEKTDPGGPTNWGITIIDARLYWRVDATAADVKAMPLSVAKEIYKAKYWSAVLGDDLPAGIDYCVFDYGVNSGIHRARPLLQRLVGVTADDRFGPGTMSAIEHACRNRTERDLLINQYQDARLAFLKKLHHWPTYGKGWSRRVGEVRMLALRMSADPQLQSTPPTDSWHPMPGPTGQGPKVDRPVQPPVTNRPPLRPDDHGGPTRNDPGPRQPEDWQGGFWATVARMLGAIFGKR